jgi:crotonobetainyl-CoA:carnitine CoA-transferase CaiB-like acyl-CoA transferase
VQFDDELPTMRRGGPERGEHTAEVLAELGYDEREIATLFADAIVDGPR